MNDQSVKDQNTTATPIPISLRGSAPLHSSSISKAKWTGGIQIQDLDFRYENEMVLQKFSAFIPQGKMTCIIGSNGAGKTTLLKLIAGLLRPKCGKIEFNGFSATTPTISYFRQFHELDRQFPLRVIDIVGLSHADFTPWRLSFHPARHENCLKNLDRLGIKDLKDHFLSELSQGQIQRVYLARFLAQHSEILLLDEPFNFIDHKTQTEMLTILRELQTAGKTIIAIMHPNPQLSLPFDYQIFLGPQ
ncbi:MAG: metal ABC transporter ATP-binding protein [Pseudobdellovibrionaceae bacterium]